MPVTFDPKKYRLSEIVNDMAYDGLYLDCSKGVVTRDDGMKVVYFVEMKKKQSKE